MSNTEFENYFSEKSSSKLLFKTILQLRDGEMAQWLRVLGLVVDPGSVPSTHMEAHNHLVPVPMDLMPSLTFIGTRRTGGMYACRQTKCSYE